MLKVFLIHSLILFSNDVATLQVDAKKREFNDRLAYCFLIVNDLQRVGILKSDANRQCEIKIKPVVKIVEDKKDVSNDDSLNSNHGSKFYEKSPFGNLTSYYYDILIINSHRRPSRSF